MTYESNSPPALDMDDIAAYRPVRPLPKRKRQLLVDFELPEGFYHDYPSLPLDAAFMESLPPLFAPTSTESGEGQLPIYQGAYQQAQLDDGGQSTAPRNSDDEGQGDGDYIDHLQNPGNTKKRKVPAARRTDTNSPSSMQGGLMNVYDEDGVQTTIATEGGGVAVQLAARTTITEPTMAGMRQRETVRARRRQFDAVISADADPLMVELALLSAPMTVAGRGGNPMGRLAPKPKRGTGTKSRGVKAAARTTPPEKPPLRNDSEGDFFSGRQFSFQCLTATSERVSVMRKGIQELHAKFSEELKRQANRAAEEAAKLAALVANQPGGSRGLTGEVIRQRKRPMTGAGALASDANGLSNAAKARASKKKKRSAIANASNPHHLRNYIPGRLPHSGHPPNSSNVQNQSLPFGPVPLLFLSAQLPPRRGKQRLADEAAPPSVDPIEEWICPFCDYRLFYGEESVFRKGVRSRKRILKRRRRARERAAAAAAGTAAPPPGNDGLAGGAYPEDMGYDREDADVGYLPTPIARTKRGGAG